jgi:hypothetical protein
MASLETRPQKCAAGFCVDRGPHLHAAHRRWFGRNGPLAFICEANGRGAFHPFNQPADG